MPDLILALPSKGRLEEQARSTFEKAGLKITRPGGARAYQGELGGLDGVTVRFLSAGEIARELTRGLLGVLGISTTTRRRRRSSWF